MKFFTSVFTFSACLVATTALSVQSALPIRNLALKDQYTLTVDVSKGSSLSCRKAPRTGAIVENLSRGKVVKVLAQEQGLQYASWFKINTGKNVCWAYTKYLFSEHD